MKLEELKSEINWSNFYICKDANAYSEDIEFELTPEDFLMFAKEDYKNLDSRGLVGVLSNTKRAIDCQVDWIISYLGFDHLKFNELNYPNIKVVIDEFENKSKRNDNLSFKLRFVQALEIAPTFLISKIRRFRNKLEHEYIVPKIEEAKEAIEISELFINATQNKVLHKICSCYSIQNEYDEEKRDLESPFIKVYIDLCSGKENRISIYDDSSKESVYLKPTDNEYILLIKSAISYNFTYLPTIFKCNIDSKYIKYTLKEL